MCDYARAGQVVRYELNTYEVNMASEKCRHCRWAAACLAGVYHEQGYRCENCGRSWLARRVPRMLAVDMSGKAEWMLDSFSAVIKLAPASVQQVGWLSPCPGCLSQNTGGPLGHLRKHGANLIVRFRACGVAVCGMFETYATHEMVSGSYRITESAKMEIHVKIQ